MDAMTHSFSYNRIPRLIGFLILILGPWQNSFAQNLVDLDSESFRSFESKLDEMAKDRKFNGTLLLARAGKILFEKSSGYSNIDEKKALDSNASFRLASVSKQFTAMGIMMLQQDGKLNYDDDIRKHLPELPYEGISIRHLLHHTGGLPDYMLLFGKHWDKDNPYSKRKMAFNKDAVTLFAEHQPEVLFSPGKKFQYSNTGYVLLGHIIERASGQPVREFLQHKVFDPLKMNNSQAFTPSEDFDLGHRVFGFRFGYKPGRHMDNDFHYLNGMIGDGGIYASARDLLKWDQALYTDRLVQKSALKEAFSSGQLNDGSKTGYGFGWLIDESDAGPIVSHGGGWVGFRTYIRRDTNSKTLVVLLTNHSSTVLTKVLKELDAALESESN